MPDTEKERARVGARRQGSGRKFIGTILRVDHVYDEITAHARAAYELNSKTDTIIEIGGQDAKFTLMKDGVVSLSIGFAVAQNGMKYTAGYREITNVARLHEVSLVSIPANSSARIVRIKKAIESPREFERVLRDVGFSAREAKRATAGGWRGFARDEQSSELDLVLTKIEQLEKLIERKSP